MGKLLDLQNAVFTSPQQIKKRYGNVALATGAPLSAGNMSASFQNQLVANDGLTLSTFSPIENKMYPVGPQTAVSLTTQVVASNPTGGGLQTPDAAYDPVSGLICYAWVVSTSLIVSVVDAQTGAIVLGPITYAGIGTLSQHQVRVRLLGSNFIILFVDANTSLNYVFVSTTSPTAVNAGAVIRALDTTTNKNRFDGEVINNILYMTYTENNSGTPRGRISSMNTARTVTLSTTILPANTTYSVYGDASNNVWIFGFNNNLTYNIVASNPNTVVLANTVIDSSVTVGVVAPEPAVFISGTTATVFYASGGQGILTRTATLTGTVSSSTVFLASLNSLIGTRPFTINGVNYFGVVYNSLIQGTMFIVNTSGVVVTKFQTSEFSALVQFYPYNVFSMGSGMIALPYLTVAQTGAFGYIPPGSGAANNIIQENALSLATLTFGAPIVHATGGKNLLLTGGILSMFDGSVGVEKGFLLFPETPVQGTITTTGGALGPGNNSTAQFQVLALYEWVDNQGNLHRSAPSIPLTFTLDNSSPLSFTGGITTGSKLVTGISGSPALSPGQIVLGTGIPSGTFIVTVTNSGGTLTLQLSQAATATNASASLSTPDTHNVTVTVNTLPYTQKQNVIISLWLTQANGTIFYRATDYANATANSKTSVSVSFTLSTSTNLIAGNDQLYTTGGTIENIVTPGTKSIWNFKTRMMLINDENPLQVWYSQQIEPELPAEFNDSFTIQVDEQDGNLFCGAQMDDKCVLFKTNSVYYFVGDGPSPNGSQNDFTQPQRIATDTGCANPRSIVLTPAGLMYQSPKGIYLLDRSLADHYIGAEIEGYVNGATVTSATLMEKYNQVRFTLSSGFEVVYDYFVNQWIRFTGINAVDSCNFQGNHTLIFSNGTIWQETPGTYTDAGAFIPLGLKTAWIQMAQLQGFQRIKKIMILGDYFTPHQLQVQILNDFVTTVVTDTATLTPLVDPTIPYQYLTFPTQQKCEAMQLIFTELQSGPTFDQGLDLSGLMFEIGVKKGTYKVPASQQF